MKMAVQYYEAEKHLFLHMPYDRNFLLIEVYKSWYHVKKAILTEKKQRRNAHEAHVISVKPDAKQTEV